MVWLFVAIGALIIFMGFSAFTGAPYVPSLSRDAKDAFAELHPLKKGEVLYDIGSGDGKLLRMASRNGARAIGVEIQPLLYAISALLSRGDRRIQVRWGDYRAQSLPSEVTIVYVFGEEYHMKQIVAWLQKQVNHNKKPVFVMSYAFEIQGCEYVRRNKSHFLYEFKPLQTKKPQV